ncbi:MAG: phytoene desaturase family protein [Thermodesulfobacteriota bacterium]
MASTIIVGGGINGLLLGALLAHDGDEVLLFEKNQRVGGRAFLHEHDGFTFDFGLHLTRFGPRSAVARITRHIGVPIQYRALGASYLMDSDGVMRLFPTSPSAIFRSSLFSFMEKLRIVRLLLKIRGGAFNDLMDTPLDEWFAQNRISGGIRRYFELVSASLMVCPFTEKTSAGEMFRNIQEALLTGHSAEYPVGGWKPIHEAAVAQIKKSGQIFLGRKVDQVIIAENRTTGVVADGVTYHADRVVVNLPVQDMFSIIPEHVLDPNYVQRCKNLVPTAGFFVDVALDRRISEIEGLLFSYNPITYGLLTSNVEPSLAPRNRQILTMYYPTDREDVADPAVAKTRKEELWSAVRSFFPDIDAHIIFKRETALNMVDGAQLSVHQTEHKRPGPSVPGVKDLYLVGDSISAPGAGGDVGNNSVIVTYRAVTNREV